MKMTPVTSSNIAAIGYDLTCTELVVQFKNGKTFYYLEVSPEEHAALMAAESVGKHFNQFIKSVKVGGKVTAVADEPMTDKEKIKLLREALQDVLWKSSTSRNDAIHIIVTEAIEATKGGE